MYKDYSKEKIINLIIYFSNNTKNCGLTKLFKLLAYSDFRHFKKTGKSITGLKYFAWDFGPYP
ncbi:MAG: Panacea domain-containing protein, partial [Candidatus Omnitrophica bacterium]|nr:Panacea domain-containing protein [Candidatus Omnitrophota bacterium]